MGWWNVKETLVTGYPSFIATFIDGMPATLLFIAFLRCSLCYSASARARSILLPQDMPLRTTDHLCLFDVGLTWELN